MKKILHVVTSLDNCGTEKYLINLLKGTYKTYENHILVYNNINRWEKELNEMNIKVHCISYANNNLLRMKEIYRIIKKEKIDIVYSYTYYNSAYVMIAAFLANVKKRITHSHRSSVDRKINPIKKKICKFIISILSTDCLACNNIAGKSLFLKFKKFITINNGINLEKYKFDNKKRWELRKKYNIDENEIVLGTVGRLDNNKNQKFIIDVVSYIKKKNSKIKLIIIGDGENKEKLMKQASKLKIKDSVIFTGNIKNVNELYNIMDLFILTSFHEGLPFVLIEAQANGLKCVVSDSVDKQSNISETLIFLSLEDGINIWGDKINDIDYKRDDNIKKIIDKGYSIDSTIKKIIDIYMK